MGKSDAQRLRRLYVANMYRFTKHKDLYMKADPNFELEVFSDEDEDELAPLLEQGIQTLFRSVDGACAVKEQSRRGISVIEVESRLQWDNLLTHFYLGRKDNSASSKRLLCVSSSVSKCCHTEQITSY